MFLITADLMSWADKSIVFLSDLAIELADVKRFRQKSGLACWWSSAVS